MWVKFRSFHAQRVGMITHLFREFCKILATNTVAPGNPTLGAEL
jgi:hypothetical protein